MSYAAASSRFRLLIWVQVSDGLVDCLAELTFVGFGGYWLAIFRFSSGCLLNFELFEFDPGWIA